MKEINKVLTLFLVVGLFTLTACSFDAGNLVSGGGNNSIYVLFDTNGANQVSTVQSIEAGTCVQKPQTPVRPNYVFYGWYCGENEFNFNQPITENTTLRARWIPATITLTYAKSSHSREYTHTVSAEQLSDYVGVKGKFKLNIWGPNSNGTTLTVTYNGNSKSFQNIRGGFYTISSTYEIISNQNIIFVLSNEYQLREVTFIAESGEETSK